MAAASSLLSEDQFLCSICLDVFTDPVTIPCGHNFCKNCITEHWNVNVQYQCPVCKELFDRRPELRVNTFISEMAAKFRQTVEKKTRSCSEEQPANKGEVLCDVCTETKLKALKSCLACLTSYCETHLEPHYRIAGLKRHELIDPVENLEGRMCQKHDRPLELFCKTDQMYVCRFCTESEHKLHHIVPLEEEYEGKKAELDKTKSEVQQMILERRLKIEQIKQSVRRSKEDADRETATSVQVFTALIQSVERCLAQLTEIIAEKQKTTEEQAEGFTKELEEEISELMKRGTELEQLSHTEDQLQFLQSFSSLNTVPPTKDWTDVHLSHKEAVWTALAQLEETLTKEVKKLCTDVELKTVQQFAVDVTLDSETANTDLILSDDGKQVNHGGLKQNLPDSPKRFSSCCVLGKQSFSSGRFYYEVQVKEKTDWTLGVARESINRKGFSTLSPMNGHWTVCLMNGNQYKALAGPSVRLTLKSNPQKVGVFVDYEEGLVSFYDVDAAALIYSFTGCNFTEKLYPYFNPCYNDGGKNSTPLIICPVSPQLQLRQVPSSPQTSRLQVNSTAKPLSSTAMAAASSLLSEDQFLCSICLDVFTDPVTIPCGHNFCKNCITQHWNVNVQYQCPVCKELFDRRPELRVNTFISEMAAKFRQTVEKKTRSCSEEQPANKGEVVCDVCTETKLKALKSCLVCLTSYCETHLELHQKITVMTRHKLIDPVENLESRMCMKHERPLELFCKTDQMCVCRFCTESEHKLHHIVPLEEEYKGKKTELGKTKAEVQQMIQERRLKIQQIKQSVRRSKEDADRETAASVQVFTALIQSVEKSLAQVTDIINKTHKTMEKQAEGFIKDLEEDISKLIKKSSEQLSCTEDHLQFLQSFPSLNTVPPTKDWTDVRVHSSYEGTVRRALTQLEETLSKEVKRLCAHDEFKRVQQFAVDVTLDPDTANHYLILSDDAKQVSHSNIKQDLPDSRGRFYCYSVLGKPSFSSGRFYYEVQVKGKTSWMLGVVNESINRTGHIKSTPESGCWSVSLTKEKGYKVAGSSVPLSLNLKPQKVGVFVDYEEGLVSFYDVDAAAHIYSFTGCNFTEKLYPYFNPFHNNGGKNSTPLIICPINHAD
ncbi:uncharacterized protein ABDE67_021152 [Symphorus nematophorus]